MLTNPSAVDEAPKTDETIVKETMERYKVASEFDRPFKDRCLLAFRNLHNQLPINWPFWSEHFEPETQVNTTETVERMMAGLFPKENFCDLRAMAGQSPLATEKTKELWMFGLRTKAGYKLNKYRQVTEAVSYGNGVEFHYVGMDVLTSMGRQPVIDEWGIQHGYQDVMQQVPEFWPKSKIISRFDCYPATTGGDIQEMPYFQHRELVPVAWLKAGNWDGILKNVDQVEPFLAVDGTRGRAGLEDEDFAYDLYERLRSVGLNVQEGIGVGRGGGAVEYCELLYESLAPVQPGMPPRFRIIANRKHLLLDEDHRAWHRKKPYSEIKYLERSVNLWQAAGLPELIEPLQRKLNLRSNQASDAIVANNNPTRLVDRNAQIEDLTLLEPWPGRVILANNAATAVTELTRPHVGQDLFVDLDLTRASIQRISKISDATRNLTGRRTGQGKGAETASGLAQVTQMMNTAINFKMLLGEEQGFVRGLRLSLALLQQCATTEQKMRVVDDTNPLWAEAGVQDGYIVVDPLEVQGEYDVRISGSTNSLEDPEKADIAGQWLSEGLQLPDVAPRIKQLDAWLWKGEMIGVQSPRQFLLTEQEFQQKQQQQLQQAMAMAALAPQPQPGAPGPGAQ